MALKRTNNRYRHKKIDLSEDEVTMRKIASQYEEIEKLYSKFETAVGKTFKYLFGRKMFVTDIIDILSDGSTEIDNFTKESLSKYIKGRIPEYNGYSVKLIIDFINDNSIMLRVSTKLILKMDLFEEYINYYDTNVSNFDYITIDSTKYALLDIAVNVNISKGEYKINSNAYEWEY